MSLREKYPYFLAFGLKKYPHFPAFGLNTKRYGVSFRIQSKCVNADTFHAVCRILSSTVCEKC